MAPPKPQGRRNDPVALKLATDYLTGATIRQLAERTGWSFGTVRSKLLAQGVTLRPPGPTQSPTQVAHRRAWGAELRAIYEQGATIHEIAAHYRRAPSWAYRLLREAGTVMRRPGRKT